MKSNLLYKSKSVPKKPLLSYIIPTYKNLSYLSTAIGGILSQKRSDGFSDYEIVVICNDPNGDFTAFIEKYKDCNISFYRNEENYGQVGNLNQGVSLACGKYISIIHDDDMILPNYLSSVLPLLNRTDIEYDCIVPSCYLQYGKYRFDFRHKLLSFCYLFRFLYRKKLTDVASDAWIYTFDDIYGPPSCGVVFLKSALEDFGMFKDERAAAWDFYNFREFHKNKKVYFLHRYVGVRRCETGMSKESRIQKEFQADKQMILDVDEADHPFIKKYKSVIMTHRPILKFLRYRFVGKTYLYAHNLDLRKCLPIVTYRKIEKYEKELNK